MRKYDAYLVGYYGMNNSGDDALMYSSLWALESILKHRKIKVSTPEEITLEKGKKLKPNLSLPQNFKGQNRLNHYRSAAFCKSIIFGGGSVLHSAQDINIKRHMMALSKADKSIAVGVGIEEFADSKTEKACKRFLNECGKVKLRDIDSYNIAKAIAPDANIELAFDLAPLLLCKENFKFRNIERKGVAINLCPFPKDSFGNPDIESEEKIINDMVRSIETIWNKTGEFITLIDLNGHHLFGDNRIHHKIISKINPCIKINYISYRSNPYQLLQLLNSYKIVVGMRLHAVILSYLAETPVISLNYHPKCSGWCKQIGIADQYQFNAVDFDSDVLAQIVIDSMETGYEKPLLPIKRAIELSLKNWRD